MLMDQGVKDALELMLLVLVDGIVLLRHLPCVCMWIGLECLVSFEFRSWACLCWVAWTTVWVILRNFLERFFSAYAHIHVLCQGGIDGLWTWNSQMFLIILLNLELLEDRFLLSESAVVHAIVIRGRSQVLTAWCSLLGVCSHVCDVCCVHVPIWNLSLITVV